MDNDFKGDLRNVKKAIATLEPKITRQRMLLEQYTGVRLYLEALLSKDPTDAEDPGANGEAVEPGTSRDVVEDVLPGAVPVGSGASD